jgi:O-acetyl-ADP-ribose deacetylase (regulator of RNase III)
MKQKHFTNTSNPIDFPKKVEDVDKFIDNYANFVENMSDEEWENLGKSFLKHTKGNLIDLAEAGEFDIIVQGCNCFCTMGSGIAREIRERYPEAWEVDYASEMGDMMKLGNWTSVKPKDFIIVNAYTQYGTSKNGEDVFEYECFYLILKKLAYAYPTLRFGFPYIGMGLAGGDKQTIMVMLEDFAGEISATGGSATLVEFG